LLLKIAACAFTANKPEACVTAATSCETASMRFPELMRCCSAVEDAKLEFNASVETW
jgi:hypothetical protein